MNHKSYYDLPHDQQVMWTEKIMRDLEAHGYAESNAGPDGKRLYRLTEKGRTASDEEMAALDGAL